MCPRQCLTENTSSTVSIRVALFDIDALQYSQPPEAGLDMSRKKKGD